MKKSFIILLLTLLPIISHAAQITLVMRSGNYMPYQYYPDNQEPTGLYIDLVMEAAKQLEITIKLKRYPWKRCQRLVSNGDVDGIIGLFKTQERLQNLYFVEEVLAYEETAFFTLKQNNIKYDGDIKTLYPFVIGLTQGSSFGQTWEKHSNNFKRLEYSPSFDSMIKKLLTQRIPLVVCDKMTFEYFSKKNNMVISISGERKEPLDRIIALHPSIGLNAGFIAFTKAKDSNRNKNMADDFAKAIRTIKQSDLFIELLDKYANF